MGAPSKSTPPSTHIGHGRVYHRRASPSQTEQDATLQEESGEIWGSYNRDMMGGRSPFPSVDAYVGPLPPGTRGIEFVTLLPPDRDAPPGRARWTGTRDGVRVVGDYAIVSVRITKNAQKG